MKFKRLGLMLIVLFSVLPLSFAQNHSPIVRLIYFLPRELPPNRGPIRDVDAKIERLIKDVQQFYAEHMENHGFDRKTFQFETDAHGRAIVHHVKGKFAASYYDGAGETHTRVRDEISQQFGTSQDFYYLVVIDNSITFTPTGIGLIATTFLDDFTGFDVELAAHELGHAFGLLHDYTRADGIWITSLGISDPMTTSFCAAEWLDVHRAFNPGQAAVNAGEPTIKMLPPSLVAPPNAIRLRFEVTDPDGIHQVQLMKYNPRIHAANAVTLMDCKSLNGNPKDSVDFITTSLSSIDTVTLSIIDVHGNITSAQVFPIDITDLLPSTEFVSITDRSLAVAVRNTLGLGPDDVLTTKTILGLTTLRIADVIIKDLTGLEQASNLTQLILINTTISDVSALAGMTKMRRLTLWNNSILDVSALAGMTNLRFLTLAGNSVLDVSPLVGLTNLTELHLDNNSISDVSPLVGLTHLKLLSLRNNRLNDAALQKHIPAIKANGTTVIYDKRQIAPPPQTPVVQVSAAQRPPMYWVNAGTGTLHRLIGDKVENLVPSVQNTTSLAVDAAGDKLYWTEKTGGRTGKIRRANLNGNPNVQLIKDLTSVPYGIALDTVGGKIYLTNAWGKVQRLNLDGSNFQPNLITDLDAPRGLALDISGGKVYWAEMSGRIRRANLDGSNTEDVTTGLGTPMNIAISDSNIYWTVKTGENRGEIRFANLHGTPNVVTLNTFTQGFPVGITVDTVEDKLYWTTSHGKIGRTNIDSSNFQPNLVTGLAALGSIAVEVKAKEILPTDAVLSISPSSVASPGVGKQLTLNLNITDGAAVTGYQVTVQFDATAFRYVESSNGDYLSARAFFATPVVKASHVVLASNAPTGVSNGNGTLATVTFEALAVKASTLTLSESLLTDNQGNTFRPQVERGEVTEPPELKADVTGDGVVNIIDLVYVASNFGETGQNSADVNTDGIVNIVDLVLVAGAFNTNAGAPPLDSGSLELLATADVREWLSQAHQLNSVGPTYQRGVSVLEQILTALTPNETLLLPNYPNPFNPETWIPYQLAKAGDVKISIYDARGTVVRYLELGHQSAGYYTGRSRAAYWDGSNTLGERVASGIYFYQLQTDNGSPMRKMIVLK